jgi:hypothetical protein
VENALSEPFQLDASEILLWTAERRQRCSEEGQKEDKYLERFLERI